MKTTYYTPTTWVDSVGNYDVMQSSSPAGDPTKPVDGTPTAPARKLYV